MFCMVIKGHTDLPCFTYCLLSLSFSGEHMDQINLQTAKTGKSVIPECGNHKK